MILNTNYYIEVADTFHISCYSAMLIYIINGTLYATQEKRD